MPKFFVDEIQMNDNKIYITGQDVNHIKNVLRLKPKDMIEVCNIKEEKTYNSEIVAFEDEQVICKIIDKQEISKESNLNINIFQGLPKAEKMELIIQKCTELGVKEITPVVMKRSVVKLDEKDKVKKIERWRKIAQMASEQSGRDAITKINNVININNVCNLIEKYDIVLIAYENEQINNLREEIKKIKDLKKDNLNLGVIIGPEGGIDEIEYEELVSHGAKSISLGKRILRTETAPIMISSILMYELGDI